MFSIDEGVIVDAFAVVFRTDVTFHTNAILPYLWFEFLGGLADDDQIDPAVRSPALGRLIRCDRTILAIADSR